MLDEARRAGPRERDLPHPRGVRRGGGEDRPAGGDPARLHAGRHRRRHGLHHGELRDRGREPGWQRARSRRCWSRRNLLGWKEIEYEVMRDGAGQLHHRLQHGELRPDGRPHGRLHRRRAVADAERQGLPDAAVGSAADHLRSLGIEGGCNVQFSLAPRKDVRDWEGDPDAPLPYHVIEVNPRVSRSSALASKATGYPIARVAAKIACGQDARRDPERGDAEDDGRVRAGARLLRGEDPALAVRQVRARRPRGSARR